MADQIQSQLGVIGNDELTVLTYLRATRYTAIAGVVFLVYDYFLCLPSEVKYIWHPRWNLGKVLYLLNRYIPTIDLIIHLNTFVNPSASVEFCLVWFYIDVSLSWISLAVIELLLVLRTVALYQRTRIVSLIITSLAILTMTALAVLITIIAIRIRAQPFPAYAPSVLTGCYYIEDTNILSGIWIIPIIFESAVCIATVVKACQHLRSKTLKHSPLFTALYRDGFLYFFMIFGIALLNLFVWFLVPLTLGQMFIVIYRASMCTLGSRIILNLRRAGSKLSGHDTETTPRGWEWDLVGRNDAEDSHVSRLSMFQGESRHDERTGWNLEMKVQKSLQWKAKDPSSDSDSAVRRFSSSSRDLNSQQQTPPSTAWSWRWLSRSTSPQERRTPMPSTSTSYRRTTSDPKLVDSQNDKQCVSFDMLTSFDLQDVDDQDDMPGSRRESRRLSVPQRSLHLQTSRDRLMPYGPASSSNEPSSPLSNTATAVNPSLTEMTESHGSTSQQRQRTVDYLERDRWK